MSIALCLLAALGFMLPPPIAGQTAAARTIEIVSGDNMLYKPGRIEARRGETLRLVLKVTSKVAKDAMAHNIVVLAKGASPEKVNTAALGAKATGFIPQDRKADIIAFTGLAGGGETVEVTFKVPEVAGNYTFICTFPGHYSLGMKGVLAVK